MRDEITLKMQITLFKRPKKGSVIIEGFPGFGLVGNITTEFLIDHLNAELIGTVKADEVQPLIAVHDGKVVQPIGVFYDEKNNIVIMHVITSAAGIEWKLAETILKLAREIEAREIISIEGVVGGEDREIRGFYFSNNAKGRKRFENMKAEKLREGIVVGVTGALMLERDFPFSAIFVETHSNMPDSRASAKAIELLDKYLNLKVDPRPLLRQAEVFEDKIKKLLEQSKTMMSEQEKKKMSYIS